MDESILNTNAAEVESQTEGTENEVVDAEDDGWDAVVWGSDDGADVEEDGGEESPVSEEPEADQPKDDAKQEPEKAAEPAETKPAAETEGEDQVLELKYMDQSKKVSREEAKTLAQKGLDYDRIRGERDSLKEAGKKLEKYESFLNELKGDFPDIDSMITDTRARMIADKEGIPYADAVAKAKLMHPDKPQEAKRADQTQADNPVVRFIQQYPGVKAEEIPQSVWDDMKANGVDLAAAYGKYERQKQADEIASLKDEIATLKQNQKNAARSTGSASSAGKTNAKSLIQQMWEEDDY
jgi:hypothetical protein